MGVKFSEVVCELLDGANFAAVASLMEDGSPKVDTVWVGREGNLLLLASTDRTIKGQNLLRDARVALSITEYENPFPQRKHKGRVVFVIEPLVVRHYKSSLRHIPSR